MDFSYSNAYIYPPFIYSIHSSTYDICLSSVVLLHFNGKNTSSKKMNLWFYHPIPVLLPGKSHGQRSLVGCSPWGCKESDRTERFPFHFLLSCIGEGNGNPLQCSCLENPRDRGAWWAAIYGVAQSWTWLKQLSSSSSSSSLSQESELLASMLYCLTEEREEEEKEEFAERLGVI